MNFEGDTLKPLQKVFPSRQEKEEEEEEGRAFLGEDSAWQRSKIKITWTST
jgi:hypothetical protein